MFWRRVFVTFLVIFALFLANSTTVQVALVAKPLVLPAQWFHLPKIVQKPLESDKNSSKTLLQFSNVTVSCVKYQEFLDYLNQYYLISKKTLQIRKKCQADILHYNRDFWWLLDSDGLRLKKSNLGRAQVKPEPRSFKKFQTQALMDL